MTHKVDIYFQVVSATTRWVGCAAVGCEKLYTEQGEWHFSKLLVCKYAPISNHGIRRPYYQGTISIPTFFRVHILEEPMIFSLIRAYEPQYIFDDFG